MAPKEAKQLEKPTNELLTVTLTRGLVGKRDTHRKIITALGLGKYGSSVVHADTPSVRGMINKVQHLVTVGHEGTTSNKVKKHASRQPKNNDGAK